MPPSISTHVLDTERGEPAQAREGKLHRGDTLLSAQVADADGRIADLVRGPFVPGTYPLVFRLWTPCFSRVEIEFAVRDAEHHHHGPLLVAPYACTTSRGS